MKKPDWKNMLLITLASIALIMGNYFFKFPNRFAFGGVSGYAVILSGVLPWSTGTINLIFNLAFLVLGFIFLGKSFGVKTVYVTILSSVGVSVLEKLAPMEAPLTGQPVLELAYAIIFTAVASGILFKCEASSGGTDIIALILKKYTGLEVGNLLLATDLLVVALAFVLYDIEVALYSFLGLLLKSILIDNTINNINRCKFVHIVCSHRGPICDYIINELHKSATVCEAKGAYSHDRKYVIMCVLKGRQAIQLRRFLKEQDPDAFMMMSNSSEIFGKGFSSMDE